MSVDRDEEGDLPLVWEAGGGLRRKGRRRWPWKERWPSPLCRLAGQGERSRPLIAVTGASRRCCPRRRVISAISDSLRSDINRRRRQPLQSLLVARRHHSSHNLRHFLFTIASLAWQHRVAEIVLLSELFICLHSQIWHQTLFKVLRHTFFSPKRLILLRGALVFRNDILKNFEVSTISRFLAKSLQS